MNKKEWERKKSVYDRVLFVCEKIKTQIPPLSVRQEMGATVKGVWDTTKKKRGWYIMAIQKEPEGEFSVRTYPAFFTPVIDSIIYKKLLENNFGGN